MRRAKGVFSWVAVAGAAGLVLLSALALTACGGKKPLPPLSAIVDAPYLRPGSSWTYKIEDTTLKAPATLTLTFEKDDVYKGIGVQVFGSRDESNLYDRNMNWVATVQGGKVVREASPSLRSFEFPFYVGKEWRAVFAFYDYGRALSWIPVETSWKVVEYDQVKVPAGQFRAFLLTGTAGTNWGIKEEQIWYAPEVKQVIKREVERTAAHYQGKGHESWELIQFTLK